MMHISLSSLPHTWIIDIDGTILRHNGHLNAGEALLGGVREFWSRIPSADSIVLMSAREEQYTSSTLEFLRRNGLRFDHAIFGVPKGERILINDTKPSGLQTAHAINIERDFGLSALVFDFLK